MNTVNTTLHDRLRAAVEHRLSLARAAAETWLNVGVAVEESDGVPFAAADTTVAHLAANDPATIARHCEADLRRLERHAPVDEGCRWCYAGTSAETGADEFLSWPCPEIADLAAAYGVGHTVENWQRRKVETP